MVKRPRKQKHATPKKKIPKRPARRWPMWTKEWLLHASTTGENHAGCLPDWSPRVPDQQIFHLHHQTLISWQFTWLWSPPCSQLPKRPYIIHATKGNQKMNRGNFSYVYLPGVSFVEFLIIVWVFHCPQRTALSKVFLSYMIALHGVASFVVVSHHQLGLDYCVAICVSARLHCTLHVWRRTLSWYLWCVRGWRQETGYFSWRIRLLTFPIYVWPFGTSLWIISKNDTVSKRCAKSLPFHIHKLRHNYNMIGYWYARVISCH